MLGTVARRVMSVKGVARRVSLLPPRDEGGE